MGLATQSSVREEGIQSIKTKPSVYPVESNILSQNIFDFLSIYENSENSTEDEITKESPSLTIQNQISEVNSKESLLPHSILTRN